MPLTLDWNNLGPVKNGNPLFSLPPSILPSPPPTCKHTPGTCSWSSVYMITSFAMEMPPGHKWWSGLLPVNKATETHWFRYTQTQAYKPRRIWSVRSSVCRCPILYSLSLWNGTGSSNISDHIHDCGSLWNVNYLFIYCQFYHNLRHTHTCARNQEHPEQTHTHTHDLISSWDTHQFLLIMPSAYYAIFWK